MRNLPPRIALLALLSVGCLKLNNDPPACDAPGAKQGECVQAPNPSRPDAGKTDVPVSPAEPDAGQPVTGEGCATGFHKCEGTCKDSRLPAHCGSACDPCPTVIGGTATCDGIKCGSECPAGQKPCNDKCVPLDAPCGGCPSGKNPCNGLCVANTDKTACGASCKVCPTSPNGVTECDGECKLTCNAGFQLCNSQCIGATEPCGDTCPAGLRRCGTACVTGNCCGNGDCQNGFACLNNQCSSSQCAQPSQIPCGTACIDSSLCCSNGQRGCAAEQACRSGQCVQCRTNGACGSDPCKTGAFACVNGEERCNETNKPDGTGCGGSNVCRSGTCVDPCQGVTCNACQRCVSGRCEGDGSKDGGNCGSAGVCDNGSCRECGSSNKRCGGRCEECCSDAACGSNQDCVNRKCMTRKLPDDRQCQRADQCESGRCTGPSFCVGGTNVNCPCLGNGDCESGQCEPANKVCGGRACTRGEVDNGGQCSNGCRRNCANSCS